VYLFHEKRRECVCGGPALEGIPLLFHRSCLCLEPLHLCLEPRHLIHTCKCMCVNIEDVLFILNTYVHKYTDSCNILSNTHRHSLSLSVNHSYTLHYVLLNLSHNSSYYTPYYIIYKDVLVQQSTMHKLREVFLGIKNERT
jgi:hypothetical protein